MKLPLLLCTALRALLLTGLLLPAAYLNAQVPHPKEVFGFTPGDDYQLATYQQMLEYYRKLAAASERVELREIGKSVLGKPLLLLFISSEENLRQLDKWRGISEQLARARIDEATAQNLAQNGKAVVWIDGGLHATEVAGAQMTPLLAHRVATEETPEMQHIRQEVILMLMPVMNPDGLNIVADWYKKNRGTPYETTRPPWLYHHYVGHDNNRDWFMNNMPESRAVTELLYNQWYPQIVYNHHQTGPSWTRIFIPPFADPVNPNIHPGVTTGVNMLGTAMANRYAMKKMPGAVSGVIYSMWWNGGMRTVPYFHNMIGILTETSHATPTPRFYDPDSLPRAIAARRGGGHPTNGTNIFYPYPWKGGMSTFSQPVAYMITASMAVLRTAADLRQQWLYNIYRMGRDAIETPGTYAYLIPHQQANRVEAYNLVNILRLGGIEIQQASQAFSANGKEYAAGTFVIPTAQAFRPYLTDLMEKQQYPNRRRSPNGPPEPPYDLAGWTLPMQMGVEVIKADSAFAFEGETLRADVQPAPGSVTGRSGFGYVLNHQDNNSVLAVNRLLKAGAKVSWAADAFEAQKTEFEAGSYVLECSQEQAARLAEELGLHLHGLRRKPKTELLTLSPARIGLYKSWVANMDEGWTRWLLKSYEFEVDTLHDEDIRTADLSVYHAIILPHQRASSILHGHAPNTMPEPYTGGMGLEGALALKDYVETGGTLLALDAASDFAIEQFGLPLRDVTAGVSPNSFFIPGSLVRITLNQAHPLAYGMPQETAASFVRSRAFQPLRLSRKGEGGWADIPEAPRADVEIVARYATDDLLMSGWAMGEKRYLANKAAVVRVPFGKGDVILFGFRTQFRGQSRATYKLLFNALHGASLPALPRVEEPAIQAEKSEP